MLANVDWALHKLVDVEDADELCKHLVRAPGSWGRSSRHGEAVELLREVRPGELPAAFVALLLCACGRWDRVTAKLIAAIEESALLKDAELDELAESFVAHEETVVFPLTWISAEWVDAETGETTTVDETTLARQTLSFEPPLRRWGARRTLSRAPDRLHDLLQRADGFEPRHREAFLHGLLDAAHSVGRDGRRLLVRRGLQSGHAGVRRSALDQLSELDGPDEAIRRARSDTNAAVRAWQPATPQLATPAMFAADQAPTDRAA